LYFDLKQLLSLDTEHIDTGIHSHPTGFEDNDDKRHEEGGEYYHGSAEKNNKSGRKEQSVIDLASGSNEDENEDVEDENSRSDTGSDYYATKGKDNDSNLDVSSPSVCE
jgi:hypothetical protein